MATKSADRDTHVTDPTLESVTLQLPIEMLHTLREEARRRNVTTGDMVRIAIGTHNFLSEATKKGSRVLLKDRTGTMFNVDLNSTLERGL